jgi:hypothetical protein
MRKKTGGAGVVKGDVACGVQRGCSSTRQQHANDGAVRGTSGA